MLAGVGAIRVDEEAGADMHQRAARVAVAARVAELAAAVESALADGRAPDRPLAAELAARTAAALEPPPGPVDSDPQALLLSCTLKAQRTFRRRLGSSGEAARGAGRGAEADE